MSEDSSFKIFAQFDVGKPGLQAISFGGSSARQSALGFFRDAEEFFQAVAILAETNEADIASCRQSISAHRRPLS